MTNSIKTSSEKNEMSPALTFLLAAQDAMPRTIGDRERIAGMDSSMMTALKCRFKFHKDDAEFLKQLQILTCVGKFRPLHNNFYAAACAHGSSFAKVWEVAHKISPWMGHKVLAKIDHQTITLRGCRVAAGFGVLIACDGENDGGNLARTATEQVWWCTSFDNDRIVLARYQFSECSRHPFNHDGAPAKLMKLNRLEWEHLQKSQVAAEAIPAIDHPHKAKLVSP